MADCGSFNWDKIAAFAFAKFGFASCFTGLAREDRSKQDKRSASFLIAVQGEVCAVADAAWPIKPNAVIPTSMALAASSRPVIL